ncbi:uncharacterized protein LOC129601207 [Paramacrobiotus metropolitanus]|uniref:uncharacterized protein LOC129601207 n=1 Tax=Paramacrobiotus metropolitanus TaxID=2943436 RepID=UPI0024463AD0|nr:uncharacterized protein LOC129601207 [Paramacrobiotus metropolitanus]
MAIKFLCVEAALMCWLSLGAAQLPHSGCTFTSEGLLSCSVVDIVIPTNFDVNRIPMSTQKLVIGVDQDLEEVIMSARTTPLPASLGALREVTLYGVNSYSDDVNQAGVAIPFLSNVRGNLTYLNLKYSFMGNLSAEAFQGFARLERLSLKTCQIQTVDVRALSGLASLREIDLSGNLLVTFDWAAFEPVANILEHIEITGITSLKTLTNSRTFTFNNPISRLHIDGWLLDFPSKTVLDTISSNATSRIYLMSPRFCWADPQISCSCCQAKDTVNWVHRLMQGATRPDIFHLYCGGRSWQANATTADLPDGNQYGCCVNDTVSNCITSLVPTKPTSATTAAPTSGTTLNTTKPTDATNPGGAAASQRAASGIVLLFSVMSMIKCGLFGQN